MHLTGFRRETVGGKESAFHQSQRRFFPVDPRLVPCFGISISGTAIQGNVRHVRFGFIASVTSRRTIISDMVTFVQRVRDYTGSFDNDRTVGCQRSPNFQFYNIMTRCN